MKKYRNILGWVLTLAVLAGLVFPLTTISAQASEYTLTILNPLGQIAPKNNIPLADRQPLLDKLEARGAQGPVRILVLPYAKNADELPLLSLAILMEEVWERDYPGTNVQIVQTNAPGGPLQYGVMPPAWDWVSRGAVPHLSSPWGPKTGHSYIDGMPLSEEPFERYQKWASYDYVILGEDN